MHGKQGETSNLSSPPELNLCHGFGQEPRHPQAAQTLNPVIMHECSSLHTLVTKPSSYTAVAEREEESMSSLSDRYDTGARGSVIKPGETACEKLTCPILAGWRGAECVWFVSPLVFI